ncbi:hypothetical protein BOX15_Mlig025669g3 [Macrostomum lignano]|uniref:EF-hand domain-containing protein n=1 Tax=Macrostomum lignano TaxID=282301 RepID=A0A267EEA4_9PLAT|nr:hypothetical protein BOX15_Mlig025669g3 [Macrostomum lignano]
MLKDIIQLIAASPANPLLPNAESLLLGQDRRQFSVIFDQLDADKDKKLNAAELRSLFSLLFGDPVSTEHLLHFENRYLLQYGEHGGLSKAKFFAILEDYDESYGYNVGDDIFEFYNHFVQEESGRISPRVLCQAISVMLPQACRRDMSFLLARLTNASKTGSEINYETFRNVITDLFSINMQLLARSSASSSTDEGSSVKHPLYQEMLAQRVASFQADRRDAGSLRCLLEKVAEELIAMSNEEDPYNARGGSGRQP